MQFRAPQDPSTTDLQQHASSASITPPYLPRSYQGTCTMASSQEKSIANRDDDPGAEAQSTSGTALEEVIANTKLMWRDLSISDIGKVFSSVMQLRDKITSDKTNNHVFVFEVLALLTDVCVPTPCSAKLYAIKNDRNSFTFERLELFLTALCRNLQPKLDGMQDFIYRIGGVVPPDTLPYEATWIADENQWKIRNIEGQYPCPVDKDDPLVGLNKANIPSIFYPEDIENSWGMTLRDFFIDCENDDPHVLAERTVQLAALYMPVAHYQLLCMTLVRIIHDRTQHKAKHYTEFGGRTFKRAILHIAIVASLKDRLHSHPFNVPEEPASKFPQYRPYPNKTYFDSFPDVERTLVLMCDDLGVDNLVETLHGFRFKWDD
ncbi:hypothetical protein F5Y19DRAFT_294678 [Xylariaceae sp. FL1651]|nr:hypothetical protein F5Y19DRAFT_294678 [Xylariaceae sp. FL1651]